MKQINQYIHGLEIGGKSIHTIRLYKKDLEKFVSYFNLNTIDDLRKLSSEDFREFIGSQNMKPESVNSLIRSLSAFFTWLKDAKYIEKSEFDNVRFGKSKFIKVPKEKRTVLTEEECDLIIKAGSNIQERFMLALMLKTALRRDEVAHIKVSDIDGCKILINGKGNRQEYTYLNDTLCHMLNMYMLERDTTSEYLFYGTRGTNGETGALSGVSINNRVKACARRAGLPADKVNKITAHRLRGTAITRVAISHGLLGAQSLGRHMSPETTKRYINDGDQIVKNILLAE